MSLVSRITLTISLICVGTQCTAFAGVCSIANPILPCELGGITYDTFLGNYSGNRSFYRASSYEVSTADGYVCLSIRSGLSHNEGFAYVAGYGAQVWTSPPPYNVSFGIFGQFGGSCIEEANSFEWIGVGSPTFSASFQWPIRLSEASTIQQDYAQFNALNNRKYHVGFDIKANRGAAVYPSSGGTIVLVQHNQSNSATTCGTNLSARCSDHGYGNTIILKHTQQDGTFLYSQYSHLESITLSPELLAACGPKNNRNRRICSEDSPVFLSATDSFGTVGGSGFGRPDAWPVHLHFEIKRFSTLGTLGHDSGEWGYTKYHPDSISDPASSYLDPSAVLHGTSTMPQPLSAVVTRKTTALAGPGNASGVNYPKLLTMAPGQSLEITRINNKVAVSNCPTRWIQVRKSPANCATTDACFPVENTKASLAPDVWVCESDTAR